MTDLVALVSSDPGAQKHVEHVISGQPWNRVFLISPTSAGGPSAGGTGSINSFVFLSNVAFSNVEVVPIDFTQPIQSVIEHIVQSLKSKISGTEIGLNLISGNGKEHMAVLSAVLKCGVGFRLIALTKEGVVEV